MELKHINCIETRALLVSPLTTEVIKSHLLRLMALEGSNSNFYFPLLYLVLGQVNAQPMVRGKEREGKKACRDEVRVLAGTGSYRFYSYKPSLSSLPSLD